MLVYCGDREVFELPLTAANVPAYKGLRSLLERAGQGQHQLKFQDAAGFLGSRVFRWFVKDPLSQTELEELGRRLSTGGDSDPTVDPLAPPGGVHASLSSAVQARDSKRVFCLTPETVGDWAVQPLRVLVENVSDFHFLLFVAKMFGRTRLTQARRGWLQELHGGGCGEFIKLLQQEEDLTLARIFVFADSDRPSDGAPLPLKPQQRIKDHCAQHLLPLWLTRRKEKESYLPDKLLRQHLWEGRRPEDKKKFEEWFASPNRHYSKLCKKVPGAHVSTMLESLANYEPGLHLHDASDFDEEARAEMKDAMDLLEAYL